MSNVWFIGSWGTRTVSHDDWASAGMAAATVTWSATNGWAIPMSVFTADQLLWLDADPGFLLGQEGPRVFPTPGPDLDNYSGSAYAYYRKIVDLYVIIQAALAELGVGDYQIMGTPPISVDLSNENRPTISIGNVSADKIVDGSTNRAYTATEKTKLGGITAGAQPTNATTVDAAGAEMVSRKNQPNGYLGLDSNGKASAAQLPGVVDPVQEYANLAAFPATGGANKLYVAIDTGKTYRWGGTAYAVVSDSIALGYTSGTAKPGDWKPDWTDIGGKPAAIGAGADQASARAAIGAVGSTDSRLSDTRTPTDGTVTTAKLSAATIVTAAKTIVSNNTDTTLPTSAAVKAYVDAVFGNVAPLAENHYLRWNAGTSSWPARPSDSLPVIWIGGVAPTNAPVDHRAGDIWMPASGDGTPLGPILEALQLIGGSANTIPYFSADGVAGQLTLKTDGLMAGATNTWIYSGLAIKTYVDAAIAALTSYVNTVTANSRPSGESNYQLVQADIAGPVEVNSNIANTVTIPDNTTTPIAIGSVIEVASMGTGQTTIVGLSGVTIQSSGSKVKLTGQFSSVSLRKRLANTWHLVGDLSA